MCSEMRLSQLHVLAYVLTLIESKINEFYMSFKIMDAITRLLNLIFI